MAIKAAYRMDKRFYGGEHRGLRRFGRREFLASAVFHGE
jgi:hypothetical protein